MKLRTGASICLLLAGLTACSAGDGPRLLDGGRLDLQDPSQLIFLNYWAVWCGPCIAEMPELATFAAAHAGQVRVLGVNYDAPPPEQLRQDAEVLRVRIELLIDDPRPQLGYARPDILPTTVLVRGGEVLEILIGPQTLDSLEERLAWWTPQQP